MTTSKLYRDLLLKRHELEKQQNRIISTIEFLSMVRISKTTYFRIVRGDNVSKEIKGRIEEFVGS